jgi:hypothetical protein
VLVSYVHCWHWDIMVFGELSNVSVCLARDLERSERARASGVGVTHRNVKETVGMRLRSTKEKVGKRSW